MPRNSPVEPFKIVSFANPSGEIVWRVTGSTRKKIRIRENFPAREEALSRKRKLEDEYFLQESSDALLRTSLTPAQLKAAETAQEELGDRNIARVVHFYLQLEKRSEKQGINLDDAMRFVETHFTENSRNIQVMDAVREFLSSRTGREAKTVQHYRNCTRLLLKHCPNRDVHRVKVNDLEKVLKPFTNINSAKTYRRGLSTFFTWAVRHHYCPENPCDRLDPLPRNMTPISILRLEQAKQMLKASIVYQKASMAPSIALALFAGLRPSEIDDLEPSDVLDGRIRVQGGKLRRTLRRSTPIPPILATWLEKYPFTGQPAGYRYKFKMLKAAVASDHWVQDILRHTSISFQLERDKDEARTAFNNGTSKQMIDLHYRDVIDDPKVVEAFWNLTPEVIQKVTLTGPLPRPTKVRNWPSDKILEGMVRELSLVEVGRRVGVSDNAVRKRCKSRGIRLGKG